MMGPLLLQLASWYSERVVELSAMPLHEGDYTVAFWNIVIPLATAALGYYSSKKSAEEQRKAAKEAAKPRETTATSVPYMNEYISKIIPYILAEQQKIYENRLRGYGLDPGDFSPIAALLAGISPNYSGVGGLHGGGGIGGSMPGYYDASRQSLTPDEIARAKQYAQENGISERDAMMVLFGDDRPGRMGTDGRFDTGATPFGVLGGGFSGIPAGDAAAAGQWLKGALPNLAPLLGGLGGSMGLLAMLGAGAAGRAKYTGADGGSLFGMGEWSTREPLK